DKCLACWRCLMRKYAVLLFGMIAVCGLARTRAQEILWDHPCSQFATRSPGQDIQLNCEGTTLCWMGTETPWFRKLRMVSGHATTKNFACKKGDTYHQVSVAGVGAIIEEEATMNSQNTGQWVELLQGYSECSGANHITYHLDFHPEVCGT